MNDCWKDISLEGGMRSLRNEDVFGRLRTKYVEMAKATVLQLGDVRL